MSKNVGSVHSTGIESGSDGVEFWEAVEFWEVVLRGFCCEWERRAVMFRGMLKKSFK